MGRGEARRALRCAAAAVALAMPVACAWAASLSPVGGSDDALSGTWLAPAEDDKDVDAVISLVRQGASWQGRIDAIRETRPGQPWHDDSRCEACEGAAHGQTFKGLTILWDLQAGPDHDWRGWVLDPGDGVVYRCQVRVGPQHTLKVTAYRGWPALGHTMTWTAWPR